MSDDLDAAKQEAAMWKAEAAAIRKGQDLAVARAEAAEKGAAELAGHVGRYAAERRQLRSAVAALADAAKHPHKGPNDTDASMLKQAAKRIAGGCEAGGSNTKQTVSNVLLAVAALLAETGNEG